MESGKSFIQPAKLTVSSEETDPNIPTSFSLQTLTDQVTAIVTDVLKKEGKKILTSLLNAETDVGNEADQPIDVRSDRNFSELDKIPDVVKGLREFHGKPGEFSSWKKSVDRILNIYEPLKGTAKYYGILSVIRNKIIGDADIILESYNTPLNWEKIAKCLTLHYADKRDLGTLEYQMTTLVQGKSTIPEFYQKVYHHLSLILNKLCSLDMSQESLNIMTRSYRDKALDTFVRGLRGELPRLLSIREPVDLPQALHLCLKLENVDFRTQYANNFKNTQRNTPPPIPIRRNFSYNQQTSTIPTPRTNFYPELINYPQNPQRTFFQRQRPQYSNPNSFSYPRQSPPKPLQKPEPMDIDRSIHSRVVNYQNNPRGYQVAAKRPLSNQVHSQQKQQRIFNTELHNPETSNEIEDYERQLTAEDTNYEQTPIEYTESGENLMHEEAEQIDDIYFLD